MFNQTKIQDISNKTMRYWQVSRAWNNRSGLEITTGDAIYFCRDNIDNTPPKAAVHIYSRKLLDELVQGTGSPPPEESHLIEFPDTYSVLEDLVQENMG